MKSRSDQNRLVAAFVELRHSRGISQEKLAARSGVGIQVVKQFELGNSDTRYRNLERMLEVLDADLVIVERVQLDAIVAEVQRQHPDFQIPETDLQWLHRQAPRLFSLLAPTTSQVYRILATRRGRLEPKDT